MTFDLQALSLPAIRGGTPIFAVISQPGDCSPGCPCEVGPSDDSHYGMHWIGQPEPVADGGDA